MTVVSESMSMYVCMCLPGACVRVNVNGFSLD